MSINEGQIQIFSIKTLLSFLLPFCIEIPVDSFLIKITVAEYLLPRSLQAFCALTSFPLDFFERGHKGCGGHSLTKWRLT